MSWRAGVAEVLGVVAQARDNTTVGGGGKKGGKGGGDTGKEKEKSGPIVHGDLATATGSHAPAKEAAGAA